MDTHMMTVTCQVTYTFFSTRKIHLKKINLWNLNRILRLALDNYHQEKMKTSVSKDRLLSRLLISKEQRQELNFAVCVQIKKKKENQS